MLPLPVRFIVEAQDCRMDFQYLLFYLSIASLEADDSCIKKARREKTGTQLSRGLAAHLANWKGLIFS